MLLLAIIFFRSERKELMTIIPHLEQSDPVWLTAGILVTMVHFVFQGGMYRQGFAAIGLKLPWMQGIVLFLKRNFLSVFLPAGGVSALAYTPMDLRRNGYSKTQIHQASGLFAFAGLLTVVIAGLPILIYTIFHSGKVGDAWYGLVFLLVVISGLGLLVNSLRNQGWLYRFIDRKFPAAIPYINELFDANVSKTKFAGGVGYSLGVELTGMMHVYIAMLALGFPASFGASASAYIVSVLLMIASPFLRGLGAVELSLVYVLETYGYTSMQALSITILYRVFEFWLPLLTGLMTFLWKGRRIFLRVAPALLIFFLGIINIISVVTPPLRDRLHIVREYLPLTAVHASNFLVLFTGLGLLVVSAYLLKGLRSAWLLALALSGISLFGHLFKALDYEEASYAAFTMIALALTYQQYRIKTNRKWLRTGFTTAALSFAAVLIFGFTSFYFIDKKHFDIDFNWQQSLLHTARSFLLVEDDSLKPVTRFGHEFVWMIRLLGFITWGFVLFTVVKPFLQLTEPNEPERERARFLLDQYGNSATDYFKLSKDKQLFFSELHEAFVAYRVSGAFAIVLEEPVCSEENKVDVLKEFDAYCRRKGWQTVFYRVDENSMLWFNELRKKKLIIGQEAILDISRFTLEGKDKKSLRNALNSLQKKGYVTTVHRAPLSPEFIAVIKTVSDEWLTNFDKEEMIFSQGMFDAVEIAQHDIIAIADAAGGVKAFLNIIPDFAPDECTYDLIRKTADSPGGCMDALIIRFIEYAREQNKLFLNLGLVPMTGITQPENAAEQMIRFAARSKRFNHYRGLREFKEKYATIWENKYLVYENDFDLLQLPTALNRVMKP